IKTPSGRLSEEQGRFLAIVQKLGGIAGVARSVQDAQGLLDLG
ncbi:MAG: VRR-NUC domain-containing protein, partial [Synechococcus sp. Baikal-G1]